MLEGGFRIGSFAGAAIIVQPAFLLLAAYVVGAALLREGVGAVGGALAFVVVLFAVVLIHEIGHAGAAAALKIPSKQIVLTFFGGYVQFARPPEKRWHQIVVSAAGPAANLVCAPVALALAQTAAAGEPSPGALLWATQLQNFGYFSGLLGLFNLLPGAPLDGGHVLRAGLAYVMEPRRAAMIAAIGGVAIGALVVAFAAWRGLVWTAFIGGLIGLAAWAELQRIRRGGALEEHG